MKKALAIPELSKFLGKTRRLVTLFHTSTSVNDKLLENKLLLSDKVQGHKMIVDVPTRWYPSLEMLIRVVECPANSFARVPHGAI